MSSTGSGRSQPITTIQPLTGGEINRRGSNGVASASLQEHIRELWTPSAVSMRCGLWERTAIQRLGASKSPAERRKESDLGWKRERRINSRRTTVRKTPMVNTMAATIRMSSTATRSSCRDTEGATETAGVVRMPDASPMRSNFTPALHIFKRESVVTRRFCKDVVLARVTRAFTVSGSMESNLESTAPDRASIAAAVERLGKNIGGYFGETIEIDRVIAEQRQFAAAHGWDVEALPASADVELLALRRQVSFPRHRIYLSTGIHGDEPAGPLAMRELLKENDWPANADLWLCPCLNPTGFPLSKRECAQGADLNRDYRHRRTAEVRAHIKWLENQPRFDLCLCLHEDWEAH